MSFVYPQFLLALFALGIPIVIHLFNFRRYKKIAFTNVDMLKDIEVSTRSVKQLKNLLILLARILGLASLIFAFAQPFVPAPNTTSTGGSDNLVVYIDNSLSMQGLSDGRELLDHAREIGKQLIENSGRNISHFLLSNEFKQSDFNRKSVEEMFSELDKLDYSVKSRSLDEILHRVQSLKSELEQGELSVYLVSDFQQNLFGEYKTILDSGIHVHIINLQGNVSANLSIDSLWLERPITSVLERDSLYVHVSNYSNEELINHPVRLFLNNKQVQLINVSLLPWSGKSISIPFELHGFGDVLGYVDIQDETVEFDNTFYFCLARDSVKRIQSIGNASFTKNFQALFTPPLIYKHDPAGNTDISFLKKSSTILINGPADLSAGLTTVLQEQVEIGASLVIIPNDTSKITEINQLLDKFKLEQITSVDTNDQRISSLNLKTREFSSAVVKMPQNPDLPKVTMKYNLRESSRVKKENLIEFVNGQPALRKYPYGKGAIFLFGFGFDKTQSNFMRHSLFVPTLLNIVYVSGSQKELYHFLNKPIIAQLPEKEPGEEIYHLIGEGIDIIPEVMRVNGKSVLRIPDHLEQDGFLEIRNGQNKIGNLALNYTRIESDLRGPGEEKLNELFSSSGQSTMVISGGSSGLKKEIRSIRQPEELWKYCLILALLFFLSEVLIIKFFHP